MIRNWGGARLLDPTGISEAAVIAGTVVSIAGAATTAVAAKQSSDYNAKVAQNNAQAAMDQASYANSLKQIQLEKTLGTERAAASASGVEGGSLNDVTYNSLVMGKYDQLATTYEGQVQATRNKSEATLNEAQGNNALISGGVSVLGSAASGAARYQNISNNTSGVGDQPDFTGVY